MANVRHRATFKKKKKCTKQFGRHPVVSVAPAAPGELSSGLSRALEFIELWMDLLIH